MPNRLAREKSPYLLQHAANPVDWYPWGDEAFARARIENLPIFLSIGYSTCHWCHVMEHESFERDEIAAILNRDFVPVKVDREERPDVDRVYMTFVQATTGSGGWPMSVWLTPGLEPFYGGTYFPPESRWGRPGFSEILAEIARAWREQGDRVRQSAAALTAQLRGIGAGGRPGPVPGVEALAAAVGEFSAAFDRRRGGFGSAPRFPRPSELLFLLREHARSGSAQAREMTVRTLEAMALGGMRDHLGGGFHRYSVDADWRVPHFEKMLYDQAQLALAYLEAAQLTGEAFHREVADDTLAYVARDMTDAGGGFYSAEDADSIPPEQADGHRGVGPQPGGSSAHKTEGAFYLWTWDEIGSLCGADAELVRARFGVEPDGNAPFDPHAEFTGKNLLYAARTAQDLATAFSTTAEDVTQRLERARPRLFEHRAGRPRPHLDDKILTAWNGLMIAAFARGARVLGRVDHLRAARRAAAFVRERLWQPATRTLLRRFRDGEAAIAGYADDYAFLIFGLLELFQVDGDPGWLSWAIDLQRRQDELFWDEDGGGWFSTSGADPSVLIRLKEDYDGAEPSATAVGAMNLLVLAHLTGDPPWSARLERAVGAFATRVETAGRSVPLMLAALSACHAGVQQIVIVGRRDDERTWQLTGALAARYLPFAVSLIVEPGEQQQRLAAMSPPIGAMTMLEGRPTAYVCRDFVCLAPATDVESLAAALRVS